jgi:Predicted permease
MAAQNMKLTNAFTLGLFGGLGVLTALLLGGALTTLANVLTYVFAAIFLALGLDPLVSALERSKFPRPLAVLAVVVGLLSFIALLVWTMVPTLITEGTKLIETAPALIQE